MEMRFVAKRKMIKEEAESLKEKALYIIDEDRNVLDKILKAYKTRKENPEELEEASKASVIFCKEVMEKAFKTLKLSKRIALVGNRMLSSDFEISKKYAFSSVEASIVNIEINLKSVSDEKFVKKVREEYLKQYEEAKEMAK